MVATATPYAGVSTICHLYYYSLASSNSGQCYRRRQCRHCRRLERLGQLIVMRIEPQMATNTASSVVGLPSPLGTHSRRGLQSRLTFPASLRPAPAVSSERRSSPTGTRQLIPRPRLVAARVMISLRQSWFLEIGERQSSEDARVQNNSHDSIQASNPIPWSLLFGCWRKQLARSPGQFDLQSTLRLHFGGHWYRRPLISLQN